MLHLTLILEDILVVADRDGDNNEHLGLWKVNVRNSRESASHTFMWNDGQLGAVMALASGLCEDFSSEKASDLSITQSELRTTIETLYQIVTPIFAGLPVAVRLIP